MTRFIPWARLRLAPLLSLALLALFSVGAFAHNVSTGDKGFVETTSGVAIIPFMYLGAKHMVTGYDHLLFLFGVIFFLYRLRDVWLYVTLFAIGHSVTLLAGVFLNLQVNPYLIDAIIGFSVVYKALDNMGAFKQWLGFSPDPRGAVLLFGLFHGLGLATKLQELSLSNDGLIANLVAFNVGVEIGQILSLSAILVVVMKWRTSEAYLRQANITNAIVMALGFALMGHQLLNFTLS